MRAEWIVEQEKADLLLQKKRHFLRRLNERFGILYDMKQYEKLLKRLQESHHGKHVRFKQLGSSTAPEGRMTYFLWKHKKKEIILVYRRKSKILGTVFTRELLRSYYKGREGSFKLTLEGAKVVVWNKNGLKTYNKRRKLKWLKLL